MSNASLILVPLVQVSKATVDGVRKFTKEPW